MPYMNTHTEPVRASGNIPGGIMTPGGGRMPAGPPLRRMKKGGKVRKTGPAYLHKGERVIPADKRKKVERLMKRSKTRQTGRR